MSTFADLILENYRFFCKEIVPYYLAIPVKGKGNKHIVLQVKINNLPHLLGIEKSSNINIRNMVNSDIIKMLENNDPLLNSVIPEDIFVKFENGQLNPLEDESKDAQIYLKNKFLIPTFKELIGQPNLKLYTVDQESDLDTDYAHLRSCQNSNTYLCIIGNTENNYHSFNSIVVYDYSGKSNEKFRTPLLTSGPVIQLNDLESVSKLKLFTSKRCKSNINPKPSRVGKIPWSDIGKRLAREYKNDKFKITSGTYGKNSIVLREKTSNLTVAPHLEVTLEKSLRFEELKKYKSKDFLKKVEQIISTTYN